jgi:hypothetical protein
MSDRIDELVRRIRLASATAEYAADHEAALTELATIARDEWKKPRSCPSCGEYMVHIDTAEIIQQETAEYVLRAREAEARADDEASLRETAETNLATALVAMEAARKERDMRGAMCEWLAGKLYDEDYLGIYTRAARISENEPYTPSDRVADIATIVATARAAVEQEEAE